MEIFTSLYQDAKSLRPTSSKKMFKIRNRKFEEKCNVKWNEKMFIVNLNKNKNWEIKNYLISSVKTDPEYGKINLGDKLEILVFKPGTSEAYQKFYFSKESIPRRRDKDNYKREFKFAHIIYKKNYDEHIIKTLKTKAKRAIKLDPDFLVIKKKEPFKKNNGSIDRIVLNLKKLIESINRDQLSFRTYEDPICSQSKPLYYFHRKQENYSFRQVIANFNCPICYENSNLKLVLNSCDHECCKYCWESYVNAKFPCQEFKCCFNNCDKNLELDILKLLLPKVMFKQYSKNVMEKDYIKCPKKCGNIFDKNCRYKCPRCFCGYSLCMDCKKESHFPVKCETFQFYLNFFENKDINGNELVIKGKFCPSCRVFIEKNGGCAYMQCVCGVHFCWNCQQRVFTEHSNCFMINDFTMTLNEWEQKITQPLIDRYSYTSSCGEKLILNLNKRDNFIAKIINNQNSKILCNSIVKNFKIERQKYNNFIEQVIQYSFDLILKVNRIIELIFVQMCFYKKNQIKPNQGEKELQKKLIRLCEFFNRLLSKHITMESLSRIILLNLKILTFLNTYKIFNYI